jgi:hypothetical protein
VAAGALARCNGRDSNDGGYDRAANAGEGKSQNNYEPLHDILSRLVPRFADVGILGARPVFAV